MLVGRLDLRGYVAITELKENRKLREEETLKLLSKEPRIVRNIFTALILYKNQIIDYATEVKNEYNLNISDEDSVRSIMAQVAGHEYGHAVSYGEQVEGKDVEDLCAALTENSELRLLLRKDEFARSEHFALGVGRIVWREYLKKAGVPPEKIEQIFSDEDERGERCLREFSDINKRLSEAEYHEDIYEDSNLITACPKGTILVPIDNILAYNTGCFSEAQIRQALTGSTHQVESPDSS